MLCTGLRLMTLSGRRRALSGDLSAKGERELVGSMLRTDGVLGRAGELVVTGEDRAVIAGGCALGKPSEALLFGLEVAA